jgi:hypothetical protein
MMTVSDQRVGLSVALAFVLAGWGLGPMVKAASGEPFPNRPRLGMNLAKTGPLTHQWDFTDLMKNAGAWSLKPDGAEFGPDGWPTFIPEGERVGTNVRLELATDGPLADRQPDLPAGEYTVQWQGNGTVQITGGFGVRQLNGTGQASFNLTPDQTDDQIFLGIRETDPANPLKLQIHMPGYGPGESRAGQPFHQRFKERMKPFGTLRFMDWMNANSNSVESWSNRTTPDRYTFGDDRAVPVESMVSLANAVDADPWFTMPVKANDNYVRQFASYVKQELDSDQDIYVEYGNEVWNPDFIGRGHLESLAEQRFGSANDWWKAWADEAKADFAVWRDVFEDQTDRIIRVAAGQTGNRFHSPRFYDRLGDHLDAIAITSYFSADEGGLDESTTAADILDDFRRVIRKASDGALVDPPTDDFLLGDREPSGDWAYQKALAEHVSDELDREIPLLTYEGGQSLTPNGQLFADWLDAYVAAQRDPEMAEVYQLLIDRWFNTVGGDQLTHFNAIRQIDQFGAWGALERTDQPISEAPKYRALRRYAELPEPTSLVILGGSAWLLMLRRNRTTPSVGASLQ